MRRLADLKVASTFEWTREFVEARGWRQELLIELSNSHPMLVRTQY